MVSVHSFIAFAMQSTAALVEFDSSKLYDETDFAVSSMIIPTVGGRIYVSVPNSSADIARKIMVHDYAHDDMSLYDISTMTKGKKKGYLEVDVCRQLNSLFYAVYLQEAIRQVIFTNMNSGNATASIAVWVFSGLIITKGVDD
ncbi:hypothetical protein PENTCL1PPCAC_4602 [Pristionchus entomophagus]|uniref:Peptidase n=1 Tax=Pristionchus entomophagus TaxID=358040 RepID=A0AAV5SIH1_9BILA|nr:hypothetical protein PENTCL1PPCAC_4602 [Pristionchus entomophagus]